MISITLILTSLACAGGGIHMPNVSSAPPTPDLSTVPEWALASPSRNSDSEFGIGSGHSLGDATRNALQDVASRMSVSIESQLRDSYIERDGASAESLERVIETRVTEARFAGWERTRTAGQTGNFWVEVRIDRRRLARDSKNDLVRITEDIDLKLESARGSALKRLLALEQTAADRERAMNLIALIDVLDGDFARQKWEARRARWREADEAARRALVFEVRADAASQEIANWVESSLIAERLRTRSGDCLRSRRPIDAICIDIQTEFTEANVASRHIAKVRSTFAVLSPDGGVVQERDWVGRGDSKSGRARARRNALDDLRRSLASSPVLNGLITP
jgi:hypothetical protein